ncbi:tRNA glutamyl-Q(34) synthetase GluQRS [Novosphingobium terrae]|uniref:tRNA glutamyl-Q(34) synthetase GluQRS n=1 Tax=Novosphingobium terrae TaxID=2726189 RepID=UPI001980D701|nr:tRNA glutamyl-Q(34) synthetase GluQRS [Novosphingobium terrae]
MIRTRFAPSPNGPLHLGHAYAAVVAHDLARAAGGQFLLRIEDIDGTRSRADLADQALEDLRWLGLTWDGPVVSQSDRLATYQAAGERLKAMGLLYPCQCTRAQIAAAATQQGPDGLIYPGTCRGHDVDPEGAAWRLDMARAVALAGPLVWEDEIAGPQQARPDLFGDVVLLRKEAPASYHLAATLDDAADGITLVTRGADLFMASHVHRLLQALLDLPVPRWHHHALLVEPDGRKLAKRRDAPSLADRRLAGEDGPALAQALREGRLPAGLSLSAGVASYEPRP